MKTHLLLIASILLLSACGESGNTIDSTNVNSNTNVETENPDSIIADPVTEEITATDPAELFDFRAFVSDPDSEGATNIRDTPGGKIIASLEPIDEYMVNIVAQSGEWFKIDKVTPFETDSFEIPGGFGWMHCSVLAFSTRNYGNQKANLYDAPNLNGKIVASFTDEKLMRFTSLHTEFVYVSYEENGKVTEGWLEHEWVCGNPVTTCP